MLFNSMAFAIFLPIVFALYWLIPKRFRWLLLLIASYYFYMSWNPKYIVLILTTTLVSYSAALILEKAAQPFLRRVTVALTLFVCLGILFFFKYFNFFSDSFVALMARFSIRLHPATLKVLLPVGISFYTFQTLSYVIDVYRGTVKAERHFGIYATFISFFPQLVAGPIERTSNLLPQIKEPPKALDYESAAYGLKLMAWGFFKKLAIADAVAVYVDAVYGSLAACTGLDLLLGIFFFTIQIYCDFSGYSDIAVGTARLFGIRLMTNFKSPYFSGSIKEFWSRWHISLSTWFRDYIYIPLGGNRCRKFRHYLNLLLTFLASGLWHGANWTFVVWGGIHGLAQIGENALHLPQKNPGKFRKAVSVAAVFLFCNLAWVFFRAESIADAWYVISHLFGCLFSGAGLGHLTIQLTMLHLAKIMVCIVLLSVYDLCSLRVDVIGWLSGKKLVVRWAVYILFIWMLLFFMPTSGTGEFVYFQF